MSQVKVVPYNPSWPAQFAQEAAAIQHALGDNCVAIHHIGSTSILGLAAKPIIDIIPVVRNILEVDQANHAMITLGYDAKGEYGMAFRRFFKKERPQPCNVHVFAEGHPDIDRYLKFRDWMNTHHEDKEAYAALKQHLAQQHPHDLTAYCFGKEEFVTNIDKQTGFSGLRMVKALTAAEWKTAKHFRQAYFFDKSGSADPYTWTFTHHDHIHFILYSGTEIIGYAHLELWPNQRAALRMIAIDELKRNQGYGSQFLTLCEKWLNHQGYKSIHVQSAVEALNFYTKHHYMDMPFHDPDGHEMDPRDTSLGKIII